MGDDGTTLYLSSLIKNETNKIFNFNSKTTSLILTGHGKVNAHLFRLDLDSELSCRFCSKDPETINHLIFECPALAMKRLHLYWNLQNLTDSDPKCYVEACIPADPRPPPRGGPESRFRILNAGNSLNFDRPAGLAGSTRPPA